MTNCRLLCILFVLLFSSHEANAQSSDQLTSLAVQAFQNNDYGRAAELFQQLVAVEPRNPRAWYFLGQSLQFMGRRSEAVQAYQSGIAIAGTESELGKQINAKLISLYSFIVIVASDIVGDSRGIWAVGHGRTLADAQISARNACNGCTGESWTVSNDAKWCVAVSGFRLTFSLDNGLFNRDTIHSQIYLSTVARRDNSLDEAARALEECKHLEDGVTKQGEISARCQVLWQGCNDQW